MQYQHIGHGIKGFYKIAAFSIDEATMSYKAKQKLDALILWEKHNIKASIDAYHVSPSSLYKWQKQYRLYGINGLVNQSTTPRQPRRRDWSAEIIAEIRRHRENYPYGAPHTQPANSLWNTNNLRNHKQQI